MARLIEIMIWMLVGLSMMIAGVWTLKGIIFKSLPRATEKDLRLLKTFLSNYFQVKTWMRDRDPDSGWGSERTTFKLDGEILELSASTSKGTKSKARRGYNIGIGRKLEADFGFTAVPRNRTSQSNNSYELPLSSRKNEELLSITSLYDSSFKSNKIIEQRLISIFNQGASSVTSIRGAIWASVEIDNVELPLRHDLRAIAQAVAAVSNELDRVWQEVKTGGRLSNYK